MKSEFIVDEKLVDEINKSKFSKEQKVWVLSINEIEKKLEVLFKGGMDFAFKDLANHLPSNEPRFVVYHFDYETDEKPPTKTEKLIFIFWSGINSKIKKNFIYTSLISEIVSTLGGIQKQFKIQDYSEIDYDDIRKQLLQ